jgi:hypothetical protein
MGATFDARAEVDFPKAKGAGRQGGFTLEAQRREKPKLANYRVNPLRLLSFSSLRLCVNCFFLSTNLRLSGR